MTAHAVRAHHYPDRVRAMAATLCGLLPLLISPITAVADQAARPLIPQGLLVDRHHPSGLPDSSTRMVDDTMAARLPLGSRRAPPSKTPPDGEPVPSFPAPGPTVPVTIAALTNSAGVQQATDGLAAVDFETMPLDEARKLQAALQLLGYYPGPLDGIFGSGSFGGLNRFLRERDLAETDRIDDPGVEAVYQEFGERFGGLDLAWLQSEDLGIRLMVPVDAVTHDRTVPPYVSFQPTGDGDMAMTLISAIGSQRTYDSLYQSLRDFAAARQREAPYGNQEFSIFATRDAMTVYARVLRIDRTRIRGVVLSWPEDNPRQFDDVARLMVSTMTEISWNGFDLEELTGLDPIPEPETGRALVLDPIRFGSGFLLGSAGTVVTSHGNVNGCDRILVDNIQEYTVRASDHMHDLALLAPVTDAAAYAVAALRTGHSLAGPGLYSAGYPFNDSLTSPTVTQRSLRQLDRQDGQNTIVAVDGPVARGEIGGPVADRNGAVIGIMVRPEALAGALPADHAVVNSADLLAAFLTRNAVVLESPSTPGRAGDPTARMQSYTVPVHCYAPRS